MSDELPANPVKRLPSIVPSRPADQPGEAKVLCERCGNEMYRMHAVWRCAACGFKTDCCGW
jgi:hypothetical protein